MSAAMSRTIGSVLIYGYGVMGRGVAQTFAARGFKTMVKSGRAAVLTDLPRDVEALAALPRDPPDLVIEFVPEDVATKQRVYAEIEAAYPESDTIIATGTSGLDLVQLAAKLARPERFVGLHYFMPADKTVVVEVMAGPQASRELVDDVAAVIERTGKEAVRLYAPTIGFLINRLQHAILHEAYYLIEAGVASAADIDHAARRLLAPRMCLYGLIQQKDVSGLKIHADAQRSIVPHLFHNATPNPMLQAMVERGETGLSGGKGFYDWSDCNADEVRAQMSQRLEALMKFLDRDSGEALPAMQPKPRDPLTARR